MSCHCIKFLSKCSVSNIECEINKIHWNLEMQRKEFQMLRTIILVIVILMLLGAIPIWPYSMNWGYGPSGGLGLLVLILIVLLVTRRIWSYLWRADYSSELDSRMSTSDESMYCAVLSFPSLIAVLIWWLKDKSGPPEDIWKSLRRWLDSAPSHQEAQ